MRKKEREYAIICDPNYGPKIGNICIGYNCNKENSCFIDNDDNYGGYECHPKYKSSLFVNTVEADKFYFSVFDYEVYCIDYKAKNYVYKTCKYPDIMMEYIETKDISEESLKQFDDDIELLSDLDVIHCDDSNIRVKISQLCLKNPSKLFSDTQLVSQQYDTKLREWLGNDGKWKLLYRASEHDYTAKSFHEYCDNKGPTLMIIKSSGGWIFGGYTTQSWRGWSIYNDMIYDNQ